MEASRPPDGSGAEGTSPESAGSGPPGAQPAIHRVNRATTDEDIDFIGINASCNIPESYTVNPDMVNAGRVPGAPMLRSGGSPFADHRGAHLPQLRPAQSKSDRRERDLREPRRRVREANPVPAC